MKQTKIYRADLYGLRESKYQYLAENDVTSTKWEEINPQSPFYLFASQNQSLRDEYEKFWQITDAMPFSGVGIVTSRDALTIQETEGHVWEIVTDFVKLTEDEARRKYDLGEDVRDWKIKFAQKDVKDSGPKRTFIKPILYRPFDRRFTYYTGNGRGFHSTPRGDIMNHLVLNDNVGLVTVRQVAEGIFNHALVTKDMIDNRITLSNKGYGTVLPLYLYPSTTNDLFSQPTTNPNGRRPNLSVEFIGDFSKGLSLSFVDDGRGDLKKTFGPEDVFYYLYAVFHSPTYRQRYAEFLKIDFPRVPFTKNIALFSELVALGETLVKLHLMEKKGKNLSRFVGSGDNLVDKPSFEEGRVYINKTQYFEGVPSRVWSFHIGGYQVCEKWLKDRKGRTLSFDDIKHYNGIVSNLQETLQLMNEIDETINRQGGFPLE
jgi:hypothetical protein